MSTGSISSDLLDFLIDIHSNLPLDIQLNSEEQETFEINSPEPKWNEMLSKGIEQGDVIVLLFSSQANQNRDTWMILGEEEYSLVTAFHHLRKFIIPTHAVGTTQHTKPKRFHVPRTSAQRKAFNLFAGFYQLYSLPSERKTILDKICLWYDLRQQRKSTVIAVQKQPSYQELRLHFEQALAARNWQAAEEYLVDIQRHNLTTADNIIFLRYQFLSRQYRWKKLWEHPQYQQVANIYVPRLVKRAMLMAFHSTILQSHESSNDWFNAFEAFKSKKKALGSLLTTRQNLDDLEIIHVFSYQFALEKDADGLRRLKDSTNSHRTVQLIDALYQMFQPQEIAVEDVPVYLRKALINHNYDTAWALSKRLQNRHGKIFTQLQIAAFSQYTEYATAVQKSYESLYPEDEQRIQQEFGNISGLLSAVESLVPNRTKIITNWTDWFSQLDSADDSILVESLDYLCENLDEYNWSISDLQTITNILEKLWISESPVTNKPLFLQAGHHLINHFLQQRDFPKSEPVYQNLYEIFYAFLENWSHTRDNAALWIRLADALLTNQQRQVEKVYDDFEIWFSHPSKDRTETFLEAIDLLASYGLQAAFFSQIIQDWLDFLIQDVITLDLVEWQVWKTYADWSFVGDHLVQKIQKRINETTAEGIDRIAQLDAGTRIGIFTLAPLAAQRAKEILLKRNKDLDIRINNDKVATGEAKSLAENSDYAVIVTSCITHSLTYGIQPFIIKDPIYPQSRGTTSIIRAIEYHLNM